MLFAVTVVTSIGYGHVFPVTWQGQIVIICYATLGIPLFLMTTAKISIMLANIFAFLYKYVILCPITFALYMEKVKKRRKEEEEEDDDDDENNQKNTQLDWDNNLVDKKRPEIIDDDEEKLEEEEKETKVPLVIILAFFIGFLILGGYIFHELEDWNLYAGTYFAYVSLSTMGFGDLVPGITALLADEKSKSALSLILTVVYIFVGISVLGMVSFLSY